MEHFGPWTVPGSGEWIPHGSEIAKDLFERDQYHAGIHFHQHVSQIMGGIGSRVSRTDRKINEARYRTPRGKEEEPVQPVIAAPRNSDFHAHVADPAYDVVVNVLSLINRALAPDNPGFAGAARMRAGDLDIA